jgi:hypothetical protein
MKLSQLILRTVAECTGLGLAALLLVVAPSVRAASAPRADALELEDKERAQLAKETMKQKRNAGATGSKESGSSGSSGCGSVDIGNSDDKKGSARIADREKTVIVAGNVYNTASCKR